MAFSAESRAKRRSISVWRMLRDSSGNGLNEDAFDRSLSRSRSNRPPTSADCDETDVVVVILTT